MAGQRSLTSFFGVASSSSSSTAKTTAPTATSASREAGGNGEKKGGGAALRRDADVAVGREENATNDGIDINVMGRDEEDDDSRDERGRKRKTSVGVLPPSNNADIVVASGVPAAEDEDEEEDLVDTDDEVARADEAGGGGTTPDTSMTRGRRAAGTRGSSSAAAIAVAASSISGVGTRKRVIDDDESEDDDGDEEEEEEYIDDHDRDAEDDDDMGDEDEESIVDGENDDRDDDHDEPVVGTIDASPRGMGSSNKKQKTLDGRDAPPPPHPAVLSKKTSSASTTTNKKSEVVARSMKSNKRLLDIMSSEVDVNATNDGELLWMPYDKPAPYSALCDVFTAIEGTSGRLEIQERLTTFFRMVLLRDGGGGGGVGNDDDDDEEDEDEEKKADDDEGGARGNATKGSEGAAVEAAVPSTKKSDLYALVYLTSNTVAPQHDNIELGVGDSILIKAIGEASGTSNDFIKKKYEKEGDLGNVAMNAKGRQRTLVGFGAVGKKGAMGGGGPRRLSCVDVLRVFKEIANVTGSQSQKWKVDKIKSLLVRAKGTESKYIIRGLQGKLRIGLAQSTVLASLAHAVVLTRPAGVMRPSAARLNEIRNMDGTDDAYPDAARKLCCRPEHPLDVQLEAAAAIVKRAYNEVPSYDSLVDALLSQPLHELHRHCTLKPGVPVGPMLAKPTKSIKDVLKRLDGMKFTLEYKYDGERAQIHMLPNGETRVFSRSLLDSSEKFPEVPLYTQESCAASGVTDFVLDAEVVAFNRETGQFAPFQVLSTRKRTGESAESAKIRVIVQAFDLMYLNGKSLLDKKLSERRDLMKKNFLPIDGKFQYATSMDHKEDGDTAAIEEFLDAAVKGQCEGLMVKTLDENAAYEPSRRSLNWLKLKKDYLDGLGDSVDLVPLGAYHGKGKRTGVYGAYLLACYDEDTEQFQSVCKIGTGFSDEDLRDLSASLNNHTIPEKSPQYNVSDTLACDVWFDAVQVWEVKAADLSKSSTHKGAIDKTGEVGRGIGLRFPRFERVRPDKKPEAATTSDQILEMYYAQDSIVGGADGGDDMDGI